MATSYHFLKARITEVTASNAMKAGAITRIVLGCVAMTPSRTTPSIANPGGNHFAGRRNVGHASQSAPRIKPIRPQAAAIAFTLAVCSS